MNPTPIRLVTLGVFILGTLAGPPLMGCPSPDDTAVDAVPAAAPADIPELFTPSSRCVACHDGLTDGQGEDFSFGYQWQSTMMANAARDPYWQGSVRREVLEYPKAAAVIEHECARCHMPMSRFQADVEGGRQPVFSLLEPGGGNQADGALAMDGVSCVVCHQIAAEGLGEEASFGGGYQVDLETPAGKRLVFGPRDAEDSASGLMTAASGFAPAQADHMAATELCASCHTLFTHALAPGAEELKPLPEQVPFLEWKHSAYAGKQGCVSCHMETVAGRVTTASVMAKPYENVLRHQFRGGNVVVPQILDTERGSLGTEARSQDIQAGLARTREHLGSNAARVAVQTQPGEDGQLQLDVSVENLAGHKLPTAYPSRRAWIHLVVRDANGDAVFESGALQPDGSIAGNDNDADEARFEPHHAAITAADQVQIYEAILTTQDGTVTTGLLTATGFAKDNRVPPTGFDKASAGWEIAVHGAAAGDETFLGGSDRVRYTVDVSGASAPYEVTAELWYQPIGYRWAQNLSGLGYREPTRFVEGFAAVAGESGVLLAQATTTAP
jgi:hypothetical protein